MAYFLGVHISLLQYEHIFKVTMENSEESISLFGMDENSRDRILKGIALRGSKKNVSLEQFEKTKQEFEAALAEFRVTMKNWNEGRLTAMKRQREEAAEQEKMFKRSAKVEVAYKDIVLYNPLYSGTKIDGNYTRHGLSINDMIAEGALIYYPGYTGSRFDIEYFKFIQQGKFSVNGSFSQAKQEEYLGKLRTEMNDRRVKPPHIKFSEVITRLPIAKDGIDTLKLSVRYTKDDVVYWGRLRNVSGNLVLRTARSGDIVVDYYSPNLQIVPVVDEYGLHSMYKTGVKYTKVYWIDLNNTTLKDELLTEEYLKMLKCCVSQEGLVTHPVIVIRHVRPSYRSTPGRANP